MNFRLFYLTIFMLIALGCSRTTMVSGKITNYHTGKAVVGIDVILRAYNGNQPQDSSNPKLVGEVKTKTDTSGYYELDYTGSGIDKTNLWIGGYPCGNYFESSQSEKLKTNDCTEINFQLDERDGDLHLVFENQSGSIDKVFLRVDCDATGDLGFYCCKHSFENEIAVGQRDTVKFGVSADRFVKVFWGTETFNNWYAPQIDSVFCPRGKSTEFLIKF